MNVKPINLKDKDKAQVIDEILTEIKGLNENIYYTENYNSTNVIEFKSKKSNLSTNVVDTLTKISDFYERLELERYMDFNNKELEKELEYISDKGLHCVYYSILAKLIIKKLYNIDLNLVQGYYKFKNNMIASFVFGEYGIGFHSWLEYEGVVVDLTFNTQQSSSYNSFENVLEGSNIIGEFKNIDFIGYVEREEVVSRYINDFLSINNNSLDEWIGFYIELFNI